MLKDSCLVLHSKDSRIDVFCYGLIQWDLQSSVINPSLHVLSSIRYVNTQLFFSTVQKMCQRTNPKLYTNPTVT